MTKVGMLGAGYILGSHAASVRANPALSLHAVADASQGRARAAQTTHGFAHALGSIDAMAASDCDAVHVLLPPALHGDAAAAMLKAGKSVFVEKPFVIDKATADGLCEQARQVGARLAVNHNFLFGRNYETLREQVRAGGLGRIDVLEVRWHYELPFVKHGPFDNWMLAAPVNPLFELGPHLFAFALDLVGPVTITHAVPDMPVTLPSGVVLPRRWIILGTCGATAIRFSLSFLPGHEDRSLTLRGTGGAATYDFGRDVLLTVQTVTDNPMLDSREAARAIAAQAKRQARGDYRRRVLSAIRRQPGANPFEDTVHRSISAFYAGLPGTAVDARHAPELAAATIGLCEDAARLSGLGAVARAPFDVVMPKAERAPDVLVVGGTGFIGRSLVHKLIDAGHSVRIATRGARNAAMLFRDMPVDIVSGSHGDPADADAMLDGIDIVYHLAKCEGRNWNDYLRGDVEPTRVFGEAAARAGVKRFIYTGTIDSYDSGNPARTIDNSTPVDRAIAGRNLYARSKAACEELLRDIAAKAGMPLFIMRPGIVIGPGSPPAHPGVGRFTSDTRVDYWGDGQNMLPLVHVDDVATALALAADAPEIDGRDFLLSGPPLMSARDYVAQLERLSGSRIAQAARPAWRHWIMDFVKEAVKNLIRHPNRRRSTLHDWQCKAHCARYDASGTESALDWHPIADRDTLIARGIGDALG